MTTAVLSNYLETALINHILRNTPYTTPGTSVYLALFTAAPGEAGGGTEVSGGSYARQQVTAWNAPSGRATANTNVIAFPKATASWGTITHVAIFDASTSGNLLVYGQLTESKTIGADDTFSIAAGDLDFSFSGAISTYLAHALINHIFRNTAYTSPGTSIYAALYTSDPTVDDAGAEVSGGSYARNQISAWDAPTDGATANTSLEAWAAATANWGTVSHVGLRDASTVGNLLFFGALGSSKIVNNGDTFQFAAGDLDVSVS